MNGEDLGLWWDDDESEWDAPIDMKQPYDEGEHHHCPQCDGTGVGRDRSVCQHCFNGLVDVEYEGPTAHPPGSRERIAVYAARSAAGLELWNERDLGMRIQLSTMRHDMLKKISDAIVQPTAPMLTPQTEDAVRKWLADAGSYDAPVLVPTVPGVEVLT